MGVQIVQGIVKPRPWLVHPTLVDPAWRWAWEQAVVLSLPLGRTLNLAGDRRVWSPTGTPTVQMTFLGPGLGNSGSPNAYISLAEDADVYSAWTLFGVYRITEAVAASRGRLNWADTWASGTPYVLFRTTSTTNHQLYYGSTAQTATNFAFAVGDVIAAIVSDPGSGNIYTAFRNLSTGARLAVTSIASSTANKAGAGTLFVGTGYASTAATVNLMVGLWRYALPAVACQRLLSDPFGPFRPARRRAAFVAAGGQFTLSAEPGVYSVTGLAAGAVADRVVVASPSSYILTGLAAGLIGDRVLAGDPGVYVVTGIAADVVAGRVLSAGIGVYAVVGVDADLILATTAYILSADPGSFAIVGTAAGLIVGRQLSTEPGIFLLAGPAAALIADRLVATVPGAYAVSGTSAGVLAARLLQADAAVYVITGLDAGLVSQGQLIPVRIARPGARSTHVPAGHGTLTPASRDTLDPAP